MFLCLYLCVLETVGLEFKTRETQPQLPSTLVSKVQVTSFLPSAIYFFN